MGHKIITRIGAGIAGLGLIGAGLSSPAMATDNADNTGDAHLKNSSNSAAGFVACKDLNRNAADGYCSTRKSVPVGVSTKSFGWPDTDGIFGGRGYAAYLGGDILTIGSGSGLPPSGNARFVKTPGCLNIGVPTCTKTVTIRRV